VSSDAAGSRFAWALLAGSLVAAGFAAEARAQVAGGKPLTFTVSARASYDSNVAGGSDALAAMKHIRKDDLVYAPTATVSYVTPLGPQAVFLSGRASYEFHQYNKDLNVPSASVQAGAPLRLGICSGGLNLGFDATATDASRLPISVKKNVETVTTGGLQFGCEVGAGLAATVNVSRSYDKNSANTGIIDSTSTAYGAGLSYGNKRTGSVSLTGGFSRIDYAMNPLPGAIQSPDVKSYFASLAYSRQVGVKLRGNVGLTYSHTVQDGQALPAANTLGGNASLSYHVNSKLDATLSYSRQNEPTIQQGSRYTTSENLGLNASYVLTPRLQLSAGGSYGRRREHLAPGAVLVGSSSERSYSFSGGATLQVGSRGSLSLSASRSDKNSSIAEFDFKDYVVSIIATTRF